MKKLQKKIKSNKGFTIQDIIVAMTVLVLFTGIIGGSIVAIYKVQAETKLSSSATLYAIQIIENIDKISYDDVKDGDLRTWRTDYGIPDIMNLDFDVSAYNENHTIKIVKLTISYEFSGKTQTLVLEKLKVKEI